MRTTRTLLAVVGSAAALAVAGCGAGSPAVTTGPADTGAKLIETVDELNTQLDDLDAELDQLETLDDLDSSLDELTGASTPDR